MRVDTLGISATWRSGYAAACKAVYTGSIPVVASSADLGERIGLEQPPGYGVSVRPVLSLLEFPADDPERARRFWSGLLGSSLEVRVEGQGEGWQTPDEAPAIGLHPRGRGPGDSFSLPYFEVDDLAGAIDRVKSLGGTIVHPGARWAICKDSEGSPFGLALTDGASSAPSG